MTKRNVAILEMLLCATMWSIAGLFIKLVPWNPFVLAGFRSLIAGVTVLIIMAVRKVKITMTKRVFVNAVLMCLTYISFVTANKLTTSANAIVLQFTAPLFILLFARVFQHKRQSRRDIVTVLITLTGVAFCFIDKLGGGYTLGNIIGILAGAFMGGMYVCLGGDITEPERLSAVLFAQVFTAAIGVPLIFVFDTPITVTAVLSVIVLGAIQLGIPYVLLALASENCPPLACSILAAVEPLLNPVWVLIFTGEAPGVFAIIGGVIIVVSITIWCIGNQRSKVNG